MLEKCVVTEKILFPQKKMDKPNKNLASFRQIYKWFMKKTKFADNNK